MRVVAVDSRMRSVCAAMFASRTGGLAGATNGGLWCWPVAKTSRPASSACLAIVTVARMRSCSVGVVPLVGSVVTSPIVKMPNSIAASWLPPASRVRAPADHQVLNYLLKTLTK
jgi:hypothetical protein